MTALWGLPFAGLLVSIALLPMAAPRLWAARYGWVALGWSLALLIPLAVRDGLGTVAEALAAMLLSDFVPFIALLGSLFVITAGVRVVGAVHASPAVNTAILAAGTLLASVMGTTGATLLVIRPLIAINLPRPNSAHVFVWLIFLVANIGGSLTPLGDPPLFLGYLHGVPFFWPLRHLAAPALVCVAVLLPAFYWLDRRITRAEPPRPVVARERRGLRLEGRRNLGLLALAAAVVLLGGAWSGPVLHAGGIEVRMAPLATAAALAGLARASWWITTHEARRHNHFDWAPIREVAILFGAIFVTIIPVLAMLRAGGGMAGPLFAPDGSLRAAAFFWAAGLLSGVVDNAPTWLVFFNLAGGDAAALSTGGSGTLAAISAGAVFMGALTYLGNAPNLMARAMAQQRGIRMPSFLGYLGWSGGVLLPLFALLTLLFFT